MTKTFDTIPIRVTPLTPVHIGCGMDFDPTNYVIEGGLLYHFDPSMAALAEADRAALRNALKGSGPDMLLRVQKFFHERRSTFAGVASHCVPVAVGVAGQYEARIGHTAQRENDGARVVNQLEIERTAHHPHTGTPYLPGSSLKGAMRTAWLDKLNGGASHNPNDRNANDLEKRLLGGGFHADPFRLVKVSDAAGDGVASKVYFSTNHKKREVKDKAGAIVEAKGPAARREAIMGGQFRAMEGEIRFDGLPGVGEPSDPQGRPKTPAVSRRIPSFTDIAKACNRYYAKRLEAESRVLDERRFADPLWLQSLNAVVAGLKDELDAGRVMLLRVGRHSGAENVTLDGVRNIKIMTARGMPPDYSSAGAKTLWLAAETERDRSGMLPFGWVIVEPAGDAMCQPLQAWCAAQPKVDLAAIRARLSEARENAVAESARRAVEAEKRLEAEAQAAREAEERARQLESLTAEGKAVALFVAACEAKARDGRKDAFNPGSGLFAKALELARQALAPTSPWAEQDRKALADAIEAWLPRVVERLNRKDDWKDARKRLRLVDLRDPPPVSS